MKKTFTLTHPKIQYPRLIEGVKSDVRKYLKRERNKKLPEGVDYWDFDCKYGATAETAAVVHVKELNARIDEASSQHLESFYIEILAKPGYRTKKEGPESKAEAPAEKPEPVIKAESIQTNETPPPSPWDKATKGPST